MTVAFKAVRSNTFAVDKNATEASLRKNMKLYGELVIAKLRDDYEEVPEGKNYVRRYPRNRAKGVGGGWRNNVSGNGQSTTITNNVPYAKYVQGHIQDQSSLNRQAGWHSIDEVIIETLPFFNKQMGDSIRIGIATARERNRKGQFV